MLRTDEEKVKVLARNSRKESKLHTTSIWSSTAYVVKILWLVRQPHERVWVATRVFPSPVIVLLAAQYATTRNEKPIPIVVFREIGLLQSDALQDFFMEKTRFETNGGRHTDLFA